MKYVMLIYQGNTPLPGDEAWDELPEDEQKKVWTDYGELNKTPGVEPGLPLGLLEKARTVQVREGETLVTDGPFIGTKECVGGYFVFEADDIAAAIELAGRVPAARCWRRDRGAPCREVLVIEATLESMRDRFRRVTARALSAE